MLTTIQLRQKYLYFFKSKSHAIISSASLIPENDPTVLFTTAGMHPLVPYLMGQPHPAGTRLVDVQKCIRTGDIDDVGDNTHLTFFEMLGNWSLGDYWKSESISWSFEFLTKELQIPIEKLAVTCFAGEPGIPKDEESAGIWRSLGIPENRIFFLGREDNWWGPAGQTGPCGPDTEIFYWTGDGEPVDIQTPEGKKGWVEIWNNVFMEFNKTKDGAYEPLAKKNVDTGMGLERTVAVLNGKKSVFETDAFLPILEKIQSLATNRDQKSERIIADHLRAAIMIMGDEKGIMPSNIDQGYVVRRLIRRAIRHGRQLGITKHPFTTEIATTIIELLGQQYSELETNKQKILTQLADEEDKFGKTLEKGIEEFEKIYKKMSPLGANLSSGHPATKIELVVSASDAFYLFTTYGFPLEMTKDLAREKNMMVDEKGFNELMEGHQDLSRTAAAGKFKGGLADHSAETTRLHTATHLLLAALRNILGDHVLQKGSNITAERLRLDFSHPDKMTAEQIKQAEDMVNQAIQAKLPVVWEEMPLSKARELNAMGVFDSKYEDQVKVYTMGDPANPYSREICGGPHVENTGELGIFKIQKEEASSAGIRRIKAILQ